MNVLSNKIREVKDRADIIKVAEYFNIKLNRANKGICPFHKENTASLSISSNKQIYKCFGCGAGGDCINLVSKLLNINNYEAAKQINEIFNIGVGFESKANKYQIEQYKRKRQVEIEFNTWLEHSYDILMDYYRLLNIYLKIENIEDIRQIEALQNIDKVEYYIDLMLEIKTEDEKIMFWKHYRKVVEKFGEQLRRNFIK